MDHVRDVAAYLKADPVEDREVVEARWYPVVAGRVSRFVVTIRNRSRVAAYLDIRYRASYTSADGRLVATREAVIKEILQPGLDRTWQDLTDGMTPGGAVSATFTMVTAEKCIPVPPG
jgi:hypothetical protein